nr:uncharacterized protein LOC117993381 [Maniola hyperantus]
MSSTPCQICGCTDLNLVDGFYYCVECGTQDTNVRETIMEKTIGDEMGGKGSDHKKFSTVLKDAFQMSGEWCKWHAYNFILSSLADELLMVGAKPTVKRKVLWIWLRYIKTYQTKDEPEATMFENKSSNEEDEKESNEDDTDDEYEDSECDEGKKKKKNVKVRMGITKITCSLFLAILYTALNLDRSDIQLGHLFQFIREGHLSVFDCLKFIPKEIPFKLIPNRKQFEVSTYTSMSACKQRRIRALSFELIKRLDLGLPLVPDLNKIIDNYITELCLPNDFKDLVLSLTRSLPCDFLEVDEASLRRPVSVPDYEAFCMSYILLALKMCFGLDDDYENKLSDAVDEINREQDYLKFYKLGMHSEPTNRLFSFREWYMFMQTRKMILCKYYLPLARQYNFPADDGVLMEHSGQRKTQIMSLSYDVAMDLLNKIPNDDTRVIPKKEFPVTVTPMTTYTEVIRDHVDDVELKLRLCEDFTQYSLKYATRDLKFPGCNMNNEGVDEINKTVNPYLIVGNYLPYVGDTKMVVVRNCDNKNWLKTKPPEIKHVIKLNKNRKNNGTNSINELMSETETDKSKSDSENDSTSELTSETETNKTWSDDDIDSSSKMTSETEIDDSVSDDDNDSSSELSETETDESGLLDEDSKHESDEETVEMYDAIDSNEETEETCDVIEEEDEGLSIFDDDFNNLKITKKNVNKNDLEDEIIFNFKTNMDDSETDRHESNINVHDSYTNIYDSKIDIHDTVSEISFPERVVEPSTFDREKVIQELIEIVCKKYKIRVQKDKENDRPLKRKIFEKTEAGLSPPKKKRSVDRVKSGEAKKKTLGLINAYYENIHSDVLLEISEHVKNAIETAQIQAECNIGDDALNNITEETLNNHTEEIDTQNQNNVNEDLQNDANVVDDDQITSFHEGNSQDTANSEIDNDDGEFNIEELLPQTEPKFDPKTHDIKQLYVKFNDESDDFDFSKIDNDPDMNDIIDKKIAEFRDFNENDKPLHQNDTGEGRESNESDTDIPIRRVKLKKRLHHRRETSKEYLVRNRDIKMFGYWSKTYKSNNYCVAKQATNVFDLELGENTPKIVCITKSLLALSASRQRPPPTLASASGIVPPFSKNGPGSQIY